MAPTYMPTVAPTNSPTLAPSASPTISPTEIPTSSPTEEPSSDPSTPSSSNSYNLASSYIVNCYDVSAYIGISYGGSLEKDETVEIRVVLESGYTVVSATGFPSKSDPEISSSTDSVYSVIFTMDKEVWRFIDGWINVETTNDEVDDEYVTNVALYLV